MIDSIAGADSSAIIYSIAETAKANNLKPYDYFEYLLTEIPKHLDESDRSFCENLLPWSDKLPGVEIIEAECCPDHIHMLVRIPPQDSVSEIVGYLKGKSSLMIFEKHATLKYKYGNRHFWYCGYYVDTVGKNTAAIIEYIYN